MISIFTTLYFAPRTSFYTCGGHFCLALRAFRPPARHTSAASCLRRPFLGAAHPHRVVIGLFLGLRPALNIEYLVRTHLDR